MNRGAMMAIVPLLFSMSCFSSDAMGDAGGMTQVSGKIDVQSRYYFDVGQHLGQTYHNHHSVAAQPEFYWESQDASESVLFKPFYRYDQRDDERSHGDIRELLWTKVGDDWEIKAGIGKVFWGVTEFQHLVDTINQTDAVDSVDGEEKLGQAMINVSLIKDWGVLDFYVLPGFRERTFAGSDGRLRPAVKVDTDRSLFESSKGDDHIDYAMRWSHSLDVFDIGLHWFNGTNRSPELLQAPDVDTPTLLAFYEQVNQFGVDVQATVDAWLWKFEALSQNGKAGTYSAIQAGVEYSFYGIAGTDTDLGLLLEYGWDDRGTAASGNFQNDVFAGTRFTFNNVESTELLIGAGFDLDYHSYSVLIEGSHRMSNHWKLVVDARLFDAKKAEDPSYEIKHDDYLQLTLEYYF